MLVEIAGRRRRKPLALAARCACRTLPRPGNHLRATLTSPSFPVCLSSTSL